MTLKSKVVELTETNKTLNSLQDSNKKALSDSQQVIHNITHAHDVIDSLPQ